MLTLLDQSDSDLLDVSPPASDKGGKPLHPYQVRGGSAESKAPGNLRRLASSLTHARHADKSHVI